MSIVHIPPELEGCCGDRSIAMIYPFPVTIDGQEWAGATNGQAILFVRGVKVERPKQPPPVEQFTGRPSVLLGKCDAEELAAWSGAVMTSCQLCDNVGLPCMTPSAPSARMGTLYGRPVDRALVFRYLRKHWRGAGRVEVRSEANQENPIAIIGESFRAVIMPIKLNPATFLGEPFPWPEDRPRPQELDIDA